MITKLFPNTDFSAFLFDCDGTIADSMPLHFVAWNKALEPHGSCLPMEDHLAWAGRPTRRIVEMLSERAGKLLPLGSIAHLKEKHYVSLLDQVQGIPPVVEVIKSYHGKIPFAVVSGGRRDSVIRTLKHLGLLEYFDVIVGAEDYEHGKPAPDCFLKAAQLLGVKPENCLAFEDADLGIESALAAKMKCVRVVLGASGFSLNLPTPM